MKRIRVKMEELFVQLIYFQNGECVRLHSFVPDVTFEAYYDGVRLRVVSFDRPCGLTFGEASSKDRFSSQMELEKFVRFAALSYVNGELLRQTSATTVEFVNGKRVYENKHIDMPWVLDHRNVKFTVTSKEIPELSELEQVDDTQIDLAVVPVGDDQQPELDFN